MKQLRMLTLAAALGLSFGVTGCVGAANSDVDDSAATATTEQSLDAGWYRVRWTAAGLYNQICGSSMKTFHSGHHVYVHDTYWAPPECGIDNGQWVYIGDNYGNHGYMRAAALW